MILQYHKQGIYIDTVNTQNISNNTGVSHVALLETHSLLFPLLPSLTTGHHYPVLHFLILLIQENYINGVIQYETFRDRIFHSAYLHKNLYKQFIPVFAELYCLVPIYHSCLTIHSLMDIWVIYSLGLLGIKVLRSEVFISLG